MTLPSGWLLTSVADVTASYETIQPVRHPDKVFRYVDIGSINNLDQTIADPKIFAGRDAPSRARRSIRTGDTLFSTVRTYLKNVAMVDESLDGELTSTGIAVLRPNASISPRYLFHWVRSDQFIDEISMAQDGTMYPAVSDSDVTSGAVPLPPLPEQRRIVAKIDCLTGKSWRAREHLDHIPRLVDKYKQAVLAAAFKDAEGEVVKLGELVAPGAPIRYGVLQPGSIKDTGIAMIRVCDLVAGKIAWREVRRIAPSVDTQFASARVQNGDVLLSVVGTIGRVAVVSDQREPTNIARAVARVRPDTSRVLSAWLGWRLSAPDCQRSFASDAREVARKTLNVSLIRETTFLLPALDQQWETVRSIEAAFAAIDRLAVETASAGKLLDRLDQSILAKAFRGELVPQDPSDEPASVLLERIRAERAAPPKQKRGRKVVAE